MLSRVAQSLYWMSRYLERVEHTARIIDVDLVLMLDQVPAEPRLRWGRLLRSLQISLPDEVLYEPQRLVEMLMFDRDTPNSIIAMLGRARDNARHVRNQLSTEMWEQVNQLYLEVNGATSADIWSGQTHALFRSIKEGVQLFHGITEATLRRDEGWHFMRVGRFLERAEGTTALLGAYFYESDGTEVEGRAYLDLVSLLKSRTAFEAYCQVYTADLQPERIAAFLLLSMEFPHSVRFAAQQVQLALQTMSDPTHARNSAQLYRVAGRLWATLEYAQVEEITAAGLLPFLQEMQDQFMQMHGLLHKTYFQPPLQAVLAW